MDRFRDFKLSMASWLKRERAGVARAASSCNAFAIATFSSVFHTANLLNVYTTQNIPDKPYFDFDQNSQMTIVIWYSIVKVQNNSRKQMQNI